MTLRERVVVEVYTGVCMTSPEERNEVYKYMAQIMGREVYTHELAYATIQDELKEKSKADFIALCDENKHRVDWIKCSERLPECYLTYDIFKRPDKYVSAPVLVTVKSEESGGTGYYVARDLMMGYNPDDMHWLMSCGYGGSAVYNQEIVAWCPLPEPYMEG